MDAVVWAIILLLIGLTLIALEVFVPSGGLLSVLAAVALVAAVVVGFRDGSRSGTAVLAAVAFLTPAVLMLAIRVWPHTPLGRRMLLRTPEEEQDVLPESEAYHYEQMIGKRGKAKTKMLPSGAVFIEGRTFDAISDGLPIDPGQTVQVVAVRTNRIVVRPAPPEPSPTEDDMLARPMDTVVPDPFEDPLA